MELEQILQLIDRISDSAVDRFSFEQNGTKIRLEKKKQGIEPEETPSAAAGSRSVSTQAPVQSPGDTAKTEETGKLITSTQVGIFYAAPAEDAEAFVKLGDRVKKGQTVGIVEAMKLMNEIQSDCDGIVREICVANEETVEYGQPLFRIEEG